MVTMNSRASVLFVLGGGLKRKPDGSWRTTFFNEAGDNFGVLGDYLRVKAAAVFYRKKKVRIVVLGGRGQNLNDPDAPTVSSVMKKELIKEGVHGCDVDEDHCSDSSREQLVSCMNLMRNKKYINVCIISNGWHIPRLRAMVKHLAALNGLRFVEFLSAENILIAHDPKTWRAVVESAYNDGGLKKRIELEKGGIRDIQFGQYKKTPRPTVVLRKATLDDAVLLFKWRNDPSSRTNFFDTKKIVFGEHVKWVQLVLDDHSRHLFIVERQGTPVGTIRLDPYKDGYILSWTTAPEARDKGVGKEMLKKAANSFKEPLYAQIKTDNVPSIKMARYAGFKKTTEKNGTQYWKYGPLA